MTRDYSRTNSSHQPCGTASFMVAPRRSSLVSQQQQQRQTFSQFAGLTEESEAGSRRQQGLADARFRTAAQGRGRGVGGGRRSATIMRGAIVAGTFFSFAVVWVVLVVLFDVADSPSEPNPAQPQSVVLNPQILGGTDRQDDGDENPMMSALHALFLVGWNSPSQLARLLEYEDPLNVGVKSPAEFTCPPMENRYSEPDIRNHDVEEDFREGRGFIYYQHLRKAGGTGFCEMAGRNMRQSEVPLYHCMPDNRGAMATPPWSKQEYLMSQMNAKGFRITANEWDAFPLSHLDLPGAVFGTTFRHPVDRWYSQYRFEHVEHRDGSVGDPKPFQQWYKNMKSHVMGDNYYVKTFSGVENLPDEELAKDIHRRTNQPRYAVDLSWSYRKFDVWGQKVAWEHFKQAVNTLRKFNLLLILDFVDDEMWTLEETLGWNQARIQVLPHEKQALRENKKSISAREKLYTAVWEECLQANVFDLLLFHWAKRMYLERSACRRNDVDSMSRDAFDEGRVLGDGNDELKTPEDPKYSRDVDSAKSKPSLRQ